MTTIKLNLIAAACENMGIGINNDLPWKLKKEMAHFVKMTTATRDPQKRNAVIMGRRSWDCVPDKYKPFSKRLNIVLTRQPNDLKSRVPDCVSVCSSLDEAIGVIEKSSDIENVWVIGGSLIYKEAMNHPNCHKIYLTEICKKYDCDTFFPQIGKEFKMLSDHAKEYPEIPIVKQTEGDVEYYFRVYEKQT